MVNEKLSWTDSLLLKLSFKDKTEKSIWMFILIITGLFTGCEINSADRTIDTPVYEVNPTSQPIITPTSYPFYTDEVFDCWNASMPDWNNGDVFYSPPLFITSGLARTLYRLDESTGAYISVAENVSFHNEGGIQPISPNGRYIWYINNPSGSLVVNIYDWVENETIQIPLFDDLVGITPIRWSNDSQCLIIWISNTATAYRLLDGELQRKVFPSSLSNTSLWMDISPNGRWWAWVCRDRVCLMDTTAEPYTIDSSIEIPNHRPEPPDYGVFWSPNGESLTLAYVHPQLAQLSTDAIRLIYVDDGEMTGFEDIREPSARNGVITFLDWSLDGKRLLIANHKTQFIEIYDQDTGELLETSPFYSISDLGIVAWSPDGRHIVFTDSSQEHLYQLDIDDASTVELLQPPGIVWSFFFSP